jgi:hypothetical protein
MDHDELRQKNHEYKLTNQSVIELGYCIKDLLEIAQAEGYRPTFEEANCRNGVREIVGKMLKKVDPEYRHLHAGVVRFCGFDEQNEKRKLSLQALVNEGLYFDKAVFGGVPFIIEDGRVEEELIESIF